MWNFKGCPRCKGDIFVDEDIDKTYYKCLQCGFERELTNTRATKPLVWHKAKAGVK